MVKVPRCECELHVACMFRFSWLILRSHFQVESLSGRLFRLRWQYCSLLYTNATKLVRIPSMLKSHVYPLRWYV